MEGDGLEEMAERAGEGFEEGVEDEEFTREGSGPLLRLKERSKELSAKEMRPERSGRLDKP